MSTPESLLKKLQFKGQDPVLLLNAPDAFQSVVEVWQSMTRLHLTPVPDQKYPYILAFAEMVADLNGIANQIKDRFEGDVQLWIAYPKKSSKTYRSDLNRDSDAWQVLGDLGFEGVRQVAIDADWSALRFRDARFIKQLKRAASWIRSEAGKKKKS
ncbi:MAG: hypothetical protein AAF399_00610 [Bacteroidota bacterium]